MDNYIAFNDSPKDMFGKIMSISDETMWDYYRLLLMKTNTEVESLKGEHPMHSKKNLAKSLVAKFYGDEAGANELQQFESVFSQNKLPDEMPEHNWADLTENDDETLVNLLGGTGLFASKKEIGRLMKQGGIKLDGKAITNPSERIEKVTQEIVVQAGKRKFVKILP